MYTSIDTYIHICIYTYICECSIVPFLAVDSEGLTADGLDGTTPSLSCSNFSF
jgi:hypothetical protein